MKIDFIKHGKTQKGRVVGRTDAPVLTEGIEEVKKILSTLQNNYDELYSSDILKCRQTAEILNQKLNLRIQYDPRLRERDFGSLAGKELSEMDTTGEIKERDINQQYDYRPYGGESVEDVKKRVFAFLEDVQNNAKGKEVLVVTSGGVIRLLHRIMNEQVYETIEPGSVHRFDFFN